MGGGPGGKTPLFLRFLDKIGVVNLPEEETQEPPFVYRCQYCRRPFAKYRDYTKHEDTCAVEYQKQLDADWFTPEEKL